MRRFMTKKFVAIGVAAGLVVGGGAAFAIITLSGSGTGSGATTAGTAGTAPVTLSVTFENPTANPLVPGATVPVDFDATNGNANPVTISTISFVSVTDNGTSAAAVACESLLSNYPQFSLPTVTTDTTVAAGVSHQGLSPSGALTWTNLNGTGGTAVVNQTPCLGQTLTLNVKTP
jgi:multidrug efflux pump subunit AcrA (membrane-fusion protein)